MTYPRNQWQTQGACVGLKWFIEDGRLADKRATCARCNVRETCLQYALDLQDVSPVVYGGLTGAQRGRLLA